MTLKIIEDVNATNKEWDNIWANCSYATFYHSKDWYELWSKFNKDTMLIRPRMLEFSDGKKVVLPLVQRRFIRGLSKQYVSSPGGLYGGWISDQKLTNEHINLLHKYIRQKLGNVLIRVNPYDDMMLEASNPKEIVYQDFTQVINLNKDFNDIIRNWSHGHKSALHKAQKSGLVVKKANAINDWQEFYEVYKATVNRWGDSAQTIYSWEWLLYLQEIKSSYINLWLVLDQGNVIAGILTLSSEKNVSAWLAACYDTKYPLRPYHILIYEILLEAYNRECNWFDFNPSAGLTGVLNFKKRFGADIKPCSIYRFEKSWIKMLRALK